MMLEKGVEATLGPVSEPYLQAFPVPEIFLVCFLGSVHLSRMLCHVTAILVLANGIDWRRPLYAI